MIIWHYHHIWPRHAIGPPPKNNILKCNIAMHSFMHRIEYIKWGRWQDKLAYNALKGLIKGAELYRQINIENGKARKGKKLGPYRTRKDKGIKKGPISEERRLKLCKPRLNTENMKKPKTNTKKMGQYVRTEEHKNKIKELLWGNEEIKQKRRNSIIKANLARKVTL